jgi:hypothetical protein
MQESKHFMAMLQERSIRRDWVDQAVQCPDRIETREDGTRHHLAFIAENENRWLRVVLNVNESPHKLVTVFFDRRLGRKK